MLYQKELSTALNAVQKASVLCRKVQKALVDVKAIEKKDRSPVTVADLGSQAVINLELLESFPDDPIVGEEDAGILRDNAELRRQVSDIVNEQVDTAAESRILEAIDIGAGDSNLTKRFWTVDPIDGTKGFLRGDQYAIALALVDNGKVVLGVLGCPNFHKDRNQPDNGEGCLFYAVKGEGTYVSVSGSDARNRISADMVTNGKDARFCESVESAHAAHEDHKRISDALGITLPPYRIDSQAKYAAVACGNASIYLRLPRTKAYREKIWDHAAGSIVVKEAGGQVTDFSGRSLDFSLGRTLEKNVGILATNGLMHQKTLDVISEVI